MLTAPKLRSNNQRSAAVPIASRDPLRRANAYGGVYDYGSRMSETYHLQWRLDHDARETLVQSNNAGRYLTCRRYKQRSVRRRTVGGSHGAARNPASRRAPQKPQPLQLAPPPLPSCPEGYFYSLLGGYCYPLRDPLNRANRSSLCKAQEPQRLTCINAGSAGCATLGRAANACGACPSLERERQCSRLRFCAPP